MIIPPPLTNAPQRSTLVGFPWISGALAFWRQLGLLGAGVAAAVLSLPRLGAQPASVSVPLTAHRLVTPIARDWTFNYFPESDADAMRCSAIDFDDASWPAVAIPHTWLTYETTGELHPYIRNPTEKETPYWWLGWGWYRKHFTVDSSQRDRKVFVEFDGVQKDTKIWVNGTYIGGHQGAFHSFSMDVTNAIRFGVDNVLAVAVSARQVDVAHTPVMDAGNWDLYGGIYRPVRLVITDRLHIPFQGAADHEGGTFITTPRVSPENADLRVRTWVRNDYAEEKSVELVTTVVDADGTRVLSFAEHQVIPPGVLAAFDHAEGLRAPRLWSPDHPTLYTAYSQVRENGKPLDVFTSTFGVRSIRWEVAPKTGDNVLYVNEKPVNLQGFISHQEFPWVGDAQPAWMRLNDLRDMKENLNCNFFRSGHYTTGREVYDYCDRHGLMVVEDVPNVKNRDFNRSIQQQQVIEMIRRDRNRPSIFAWCMGDESDHPADSRWAHDEDPTRLIHARDCPGDLKGQFITLPVYAIRLGRLMSCTIRGWYGPEEWSFEPQNHQSTSNEERQHNMALGGKGSASGDTGSDGRIDQRNMIVWLYEDHGCARTYQNEPVLNINPKGWVDAYRYPKLAYYLWQANHSTAPMVYVHPQYWRAGYLGQKRDFTVDSNCDEVELKLDGRSLGTQRPSAANLHVVTFRDVPVTRGTLVAEGRKDGKTVTTRLPMTGEPARLALTSEQKNLEAALDSVAIIKADIVDLNGDHVVGATNTVRWSVEGPASLVGAEVYQTDFAKNMALDGTMYIDMPTANVIRATGKVGKVRVRIQAAGLVAGEITLEVLPARPAPNSTLVSQPLLADTARTPAKRAFSVPREPAIPEEMSPRAGQLVVRTSADVASALSRDQPRLVAGTPEFDALCATVAAEARHNDGVVPACDVAFAIARFNRARALGALLAGFELPGAFASAVRTHFCDEVIRDGNELSLPEQRVWMRRVPAACDVIVAAPDDSNPPRGRDTTRPITASTPLTANEVDAVALAIRARPALAELPDDALVAALERLASINPLVRRTTMITGDRKTGDQRRVYRYSLAKGRPLLVPPLEWLRAGYKPGANPFDAKTPSYVESGRGGNRPRAD